MEKVTVTTLFSSLCSPTTSSFPIRSSPANRKRDAGEGSSEKRGWVGVSDDVKEQSKILYSIGQWPKTVRQKGGNQSLGSSDPLRGRTAFSTSCSVQRDTSRGFSFCRSFSPLRRALALPSSSSSRNSSDMEWGKGSHCNNQNQKLATMQPANHKPANELTSQREMVQSSLLSIPRLRSG